MLSESVPLAGLTDQSLTLLVSSVRRLTASGVPGGGTAPPEHSGDLVGRAETPDRLFLHDRGHGLGLAFVQAGDQERFDHPRDGLGSFDRIILPPAGNLYISPSRVGVVAR